jgi:hypothetical protein
MDESRFQEARASGIDGSWLRPKDWLIMHQGHGNGSSWCFGGSWGDTTAAKRWVSEKEVGVGKAPVAEKSSLLRRARSFPARLEMGLASAYPFFFQLDGNLRL